MGLEYLVSERHAASGAAAGGAAAAHGLGAAAEGLVPAQDAGGDEEVMLAVLEQEFTQRSTSNSTRT